jgi:hypothetical protein
MNTSHKSKAFLLVTAISLLSAFAQAAPMDAVGFYARCYGHLTGRPLPLKHPYRPGLRDGSIDPLAACKALLDKGNLDTTTHQVSADPESALVFQQMFHLHRTWFNVTDFSQMAGFENNGTMDMFDPSEPALALTSILFQGGPQAEEYRQIFKESHGYYPIRISDPVENAREYYHHLTPLPSRIDGEYGALKNSLPIVALRSERRWSGYDGAGSDTLTFTPIYTGELMGVKWDDRTGNFTNYTPEISWYFGTHYSYFSYEENATTTQMAKNFSAFARNGGGVLGSPVNMMLNWGQPPGLVNEGALKMPRRWIKNTMESLMCKTFPTVRESDVFQFIDATPGPGHAPFRASASCIACHATFDQLAAVGRNFHASATDLSGFPDPVTGYNIKTAHLMGKFLETLPDSGVWSSASVPNYRHQAPVGRIFFRDFGGNLIDQKVTGIQAAGDVLAETNDLYQCAAKRYFKYFTGYDVPLYDRGDPRYAQTLTTITPLERNLRLYIEKLGADFKVHQSSKKLIQSIMSSDYYRDYNNNPAGI